MKMALTLISVLFCHQVMARSVCTIVFANESASDYESRVLYQSIIRNQDILNVKGYRLLSVYHEINNSEAAYIYHAGHGTLGMEIHGLGESKVNLFSGSGRSTHLAMRNMMRKISPCRKRI